MAKDTTIAQQELTAIKEQEQAVQRTKREWQDRKDDLAQARKAYEKEIELLQEMIRGDDAPLFKDAAEAEEA